MLTLAGVAPPGPSWQHIIVQVVHQMRYEANIMNRGVNRVKRGPYTTPEDTVPDLQVVRQCQHTQLRLYIARYRIYKFGGVLQPTGSARDACWWYVGCPARHSSMQ